MSRDGVLSLRDYPGILMGPIFDKELRVASRRKRYYVLRSLYLLMLGILVGVVWLTWNVNLGFKGSVFSASRMSEVGRMVIISVAWFQFIGSQIAAVLFFSHSICEEMNRGTLNVLMTTPITSFQIVAGKFFSRLVQLILVLCLSLSTLSIVYVFGGVHWSFIISSFCVTFSAVVFSSALTMFCSGRLKRPYAVILIMVVFLSIYYFLGMTLVRSLSYLSVSTDWFLLIHPVAAMVEITNPGATGLSPVGNPFVWGWHCVVMLGISGILLALTVVRLRKSMLTFAFEDSRKRHGVWARLKRFFFGVRSGYPIYFEGLSIRKWFSWRAVLLILILMGGYAAGYYVMYLGQGGVGQVVCQTYTMTIWLVLFIRTIVGASTAITREKESRSLSALLCCPMNDKKIIMGKAIEVFWANRAGWIVLLINASVSIVIYQVLIYKSNNIMIPGGIFLYSCVSILSVLTSLVFIIGFGLYLSVRLKSSTSAVVSGLLGYLVWYFIRYLIMIIPLVILHQSSYYVVTLLLNPISDFVAGLFFFWRANRSLRKYAFA